LTEREAHEITMRFHDAHVAEFQDNPSEARKASNRENDAALRAFFRYVDPHLWERRQMRE
jgi:hypothetical protein